jgi:hypothetical protein
VKRFDSGPVSECFELRLAWHPRIRSKISNFRRATLVTLPRIVSNNGKNLIIIAESASTVIDLTWRFETISSNISL